MTNSIRNRILYKGAVDMGLSEVAIVHGMLSVRRPDAQDRGWHPILIIPPYVQRAIVKAQQQEQAEVKKIQARIAKRWKGKL